MLITLGLFEGEMVRFIFLDKEPIRRYVSDLPYFQFPGLRRFLIDVQEKTPAGAVIGLWFPEAGRDPVLYELAYHRAVFELEGRRVLPLLYRTEARFLSGNLSRVEYVACWRCEKPLPGFRHITPVEGGLLARRR